uniref:RWP-RK domain-containing protein n=1 Tax=Guillardia theta TaxID=55529 RepID=A0A7S4KEA1_GUITH|mmetsp:Transcript_23240/g.75586  ORF Transcript_23240/g.75586 Transcript_23240/m.75586 type:complete len:502 (+) Transcript_23240:73-1578(+)
MNWQHPRIDPYGSYVDPYGHGGMDYMLGISQDDQHFLSSGTTREYEELARRKAEHMEAAEHIAPQHNHPMNAVRSSRLTEKVLREHFHLPLVDVARKFGMCTTAFKKLCRKQGVMQWPHRTLRSLEKKIASLRAEQKFTNDHNSIEDQVKKLQQKREAILSGGLAALEGEELLASTSDDSSSVDSRSTACSGNSSPRAHDVLSNLALDDSSSVGSNSSQPEERQPARSRNSTERSEEEAFNGSEARDHPSLIVKPSTESSARPEKFDFSFGGDFMQRNMPRGRGMMAFQDYHDPYGRMGPMGPYRPREGPMFGPGRGIPYPPTSAYAHPMPMAGHHPAMMWYGDFARDSGAPDQRTMAALSSEHPAVLQQQVQSLMLEISNLHTVVRAITKEKDEWARKCERALAEAEHFRESCHQLEAQLQALQVQGSNNYRQRAEDKAIDEISRDVNESPPEDGRCSQDHLDIGSACKEETERHRDGPSLSASDLDAGMHAPWTDIHPD